jgi:hypothetical protein
MAQTSPQEVAPFRVGGGCPGVFGPYPSAGLDEWREFYEPVSRHASEKLAFVRSRGSNAPPY